MGNIRRVIVTSLKRLHIGPTRLYFEYSIKMKKLFPTKVGKSFL